MNSGFARFSQHLLELTIVKDKEIKLADMLIKQTYDVLTSCEICPSCGEPIDGEHLKNCQLSSIVNKYVDYKINIEKLEDETEKIHEGYQKYLDNLSIEYTENDIFSKKII
jgi:hypothetical protein